MLCKYYIKNVIDNTSNDFLTSTDEMLDVAI